MDNYLTTHYKGKYRVRAHYDQSTNDFVRDAEGNLDDSFGDFYLLGKAGIEIKHGTGSELACYIPRLGTGYNIIREYCKVTTGKELKNVDKAVESLKKAGYMNDCDILSEEVFFTFDAKHLDTLAPIVQLRTSGASISPFSNKNLPKVPYEIPKKDMDRYKKAKGDLTGLQISRLQNDFINENLEADVKSKMRLEKLKALQYLHAHGYFDDYCEWLKKNNV